MINVKAISKNLFIKFCLILAGFYPILPFNLKGALAAVFLLLALFSLRHKNKDFNYLFFINAFLYIIYLLSLFYSEDLKRGFTVLETTLSILIFPLVFFLLSGNLNAARIILNYERYFKFTFIASSFFLSILIFLFSFYFDNFIKSEFKANAFAQQLENGFFWLEDHPIYLSIYISLSLLMVISIFKKAKQKKILFFISLIQLFVLMILSRKGVIIAFGISSFLFFLIGVKKKREVLLPISLFLIFIFFFVFKYSPDTIKRFKEVFDVKSYSKIEAYSSTSIRYAIYKCAISTASKNLLIGHGVGDVKTELDKCYEKESSILLKKNYNSHNQYIGIVLNIGVIGVLLFLISLLLNFRLYYLIFDHFAFCMLLMFTFVMVFENILDRQNGVVLFTFLLNFYTFKGLYLYEQKNK